MIRYDQKYYQRESKIHKRKNFPENQVDADIKYGLISSEGQPSGNTQTAVQNYEFPYKFEAIDPKLSARDKVLVTILATEDSVRGQAYLRLIKTVPGVCIGAATVTNEKGYCYAMAIDTREIEISPEHLKEFDLSADDDFLDFPL
ncbi:hypothetical protein TSAR_002518 [Trichomalopsis sarcophagae]|uniref:Uncharacterized protein n=1 Tax=Trichomalopsis sarcophagae TaxID=543379 RepID=A0A232EV30_9HYME|nr:hypothetical protein TSAR_002518 [Trichomalopsis sarcophagae]